VTTEQPAQPLVVARIGACYGVRGWVRLQCFTESIETLAELPRLWLKTPRGCAPVELGDVRAHGKGYIAALSGIEDRDQAEQLRGAELLAEESDLPAPGAGEFYWRQLEGLEVWCEDPGQSGQSGQNGQAGHVQPQAMLIGRVHHLLETGANDVLVVRPCAGGLDQRERLIPFLIDEVVREVDLEAGRVVVRWFLDD
jgi:16S rRNA processing protein RimM